MLRASRGYGIIETLIVLIIISILSLVVMSRYERLIREARETALRSELGNIRQSVEFFRMTRGRYPGSLKELMVTGIVLPYADPRQEVFRKTYLQHYAVDGEWNILDPFGIPYTYDRQTGRVRSCKRGFEQW